MKTVLLILGLIAIAIGIFWMLQGFGIVNWPENSMMIAKSIWAYYGGILAVVGLGLVWFAKKD